MIDLAGFALAVLVIELTPGPNMAWLAGLSVAEGRRTGYAAVAGVTLGLVVNAVFAALGATALLSGSALAWDVLRYGGGAFMLWLAWEAWRDAGSSSTARSAAHAGSQLRALRSGIIANLLNPKAFLFYVSVAPHFLHERLPTHDQMAVLAAISIGIATLVHLALVTFAGRAHRWVSNNDRTRLVRRALAVLMVGVAAWFVLGLGR